MSAVAKSPRRSQRLWAGLLAVLLAGFLLAPWPLLDKLWAVGYGICPQPVSYTHLTLPTTPYV